MHPHAFARQFFGNNAPHAGSVGAIAIAIEHLEAINLPTLPFFHLAPEPDWNVGHAKIKIGQIGQLLAVKIAALDDNASPPARFLFDRINCQRFDKSCRYVRQPEWRFYQSTRCCD
jgi:hypothetical protein